MNAQTTPTGSAASAEMSGASSAVANRRFIVTASRHRDQSRSRRALHLEHVQGCHRQGIGLERLSTERPLRAVLSRFFVRDDFRRTLPGQSRTARNRDDRRAAGEWRPAVDFANTKLCRLGAGGLEVSSAPGSVLGTLRRRLRPLKWFPASRTGLVAGVVVAGFGLAPVYLSPLSNYLLTAHGLRGATFFYAFAFGIAVCGLAQLLANPPAGYVPPEERRPRREPLADRSPPAWPRADSAAADLLSAVVHLLHRRGCGSDGHQQHERHGEEKHGGRCLRGGGSYGAGQRRAAASPRVSSRTRSAGVKRCFWCWCSRRS